jgi:hypothetical protein
MMAASTWMAHSKLSKLCVLPLMMTWKDLSYPLPQCSQTAIEASSVFLTRGPPGTNYRSPKNPSMKRTITTAPISQIRLFMSRYFAMRRRNGEAMLMEYKFHLTEPFQSKAGRPLIVRVSLLICVNLDILRLGAFLSVPAGTAVTSRRSTLKSPSFA